jgi:hypothetical protein
VKKASENLIQTSEDVSESIDKMAKKHIENVKANKYNAQEAEKLNSVLSSQIRGFLENAKATNEEIENMHVLDKIISSTDGSYKALSKTISDNISKAYSEIKVMQALYEQGLLNEEGMQNYNSALKNFKILIGDSADNVYKLTSELNIHQEDAEMIIRQYKDVNIQLRNLSKNTDESAFKISDLAKTINNLPGFKTIEIEAKVDDAKNKFNNLFTGLSTRLNNIFSNFGLNVKIPEIKLATGGIINNPGHGVPLGNGIVGGEVSKEGVIPLTDSQTMQELGATIGRYITINANIINTMNGRIISREMQKINKNNDFSKNS